MDAAYTVQCFKFKNGEAQRPQDKKQLKRQVTRSLSSKALSRRMSITNKGRILGVYPTTFLGALLVPKKHAGKDPASKGITSLLAQHPHAIDCLVYVMETRVEIVDKRKKMLQELPIEGDGNVHARRANESTGITQVKLFNSDKYFCVTVDDPVEQGFNVVVMLTPIKKNPSEVSLRRTLFNAATAAKKTRDSHARKRRASGSGEQETGTIINVIAAGFVGSMPVDSATGDDTVRDAYTRIVKNKKNRKEAVLVQIGTEGIRVFASLTGTTIATGGLAHRFAEELRLRFVLPDIAYSSAIQSINSRAFAFIVRDQQLKLLTCFAFELDPRGVQEIQLSVKETFAAAMKEKSQMGNDPFKAIGARVRAPADLFKRQIHRRHLKAKKPIGAGQVMYTVSSIR